MSAHFDLDPLERLDSEQRFGWTHVMSRRLRVLLAENDWREIQQVARRKGMTVAGWVRQALRTARRSEPGTDSRMKLEAVRTASSYAFPTAAIGEMLDQIGPGALGEGPR